MTAPTCPDCGTALPADSPQSLCPACLLRQALASRTVVNGDARSSAPPPTPEEIADKFPQFEILECLGRGGMGVVYKARQKSLNRLVAIKILAPDREHEPRFAERFAREAELLARLNHPHIVTIHDFGETGGLFYLVMEFVDGVNLRDLLRDGKLESKQALAIVPPICEALQYAHDKGIVHRDIKPENLLLDREGRIKIADFGIAALMGAEGETSGTPPYMAPEQGGDRTGIDHRADLYALGVVLYEMLTGERPGKDLIAPSRKVQIDVRLDEMVLRALEKQPERRYQTAGEFRTVVETLQAVPPVPPVAPPLPAVAPQTSGPLKRFLLLFSTIAFPVGLLGAGLGWLLSHFIPHIDGSQTLARNLALIGILLSPLAAIGVMFFQTRRAGGVYDPASKPGKRWILLSQICMVILVFLGKSWLVPAHASSDNEKVLIGRAKFDFEIPQTLSGGWGAELPVYQGQTTRWFPPNGQPVQMKDGRTLYFRVQTTGLENGRPKLLAGISEDAKVWTTKSVEMGPSRRSTSLDLDHGIKATLQWNPATPPVSEANPRPVNALRTNSGLSVMTGIVFVVLFLGGILLLAILIARSKSRGSKAAIGIGCAVLLFGGLLLAAASVVLFYFTKPVMRSGPTSIPVQPPAPASPPALLPEVEAEANGNDANEALKSITLSVSGAVARPGSYTLRADATLIDALAAAGGWTDSAKLDEVFINDDRNGAKHDLRKILDGRAPNPALATGRNIFVSRRNP